MAPEPYRRVFKSSNRSTEPTAKEMPFFVANTETSQYMSFLNPTHINKFNTQDSVLVVSSFPQKGQTYDPKALAVAPFTKNKLDAISKQAYTSGLPIKFVILADILGDKPFSYQENNHLVIRCWKRNNLNVWLNLQKIVNLFPRAKVMVIEHEFGIFGLKHLITAQFPLFLLVNKLKGLRINLILHQVVFDLKQLSGHLQLPPNSPKIKIFNKLLRFNYFLFGQLSNHIIVFDNSLKNKLGKYVNPSKITSLSLANTPIKLSSKAKLRHKLHLEKDTFYLLFLGYITWYKGADLLVTTFNKIKSQLNHKKKIKLLFAGGQSSSLQIDTKYLRWLQKLNRQMAKNPNIITTGVLDEKSLFEYAKAADLMIMPYRLLMSASGPFTIAQSTHMPVLLSNHLKGIVESPDFSASLSESQLIPADLFYKNPKELTKKINLSIENPKFLLSLSRFMKNLSLKRTTTKQAHQYLSIFRKDNRQLDLQTVLAKSF